MPDAKQYYAKLLLFGEYTIIKGSAALAVPFRAFSGCWAQLPDPKMSALQQQLLAFARFLSDLHRSRELLAPLEVERFQKELEGGLFFEANIPVGYGLGSSGALCAGVYDRFTAAEDAVELPVLRSRLAQLERFFHGSSSGTDPLVSYLDRPLQIDKEGGIHPISLPPAGSATLFLLDTKIPRQTEPLVAYFLEQCEKKAFQTWLQSRLIPATDTAVEALLAGDWAGLTISFSDISRLQLDHLSRLIPEALQTVWRKGLTGGEYALKLCGAGGGGFLLGLTNNWQATAGQLQSWPLYRFIPANAEAEN